MTDPGAVSSALAAIKTGVGLLSGLAAAESAVDKAALKLKIVEISTALFDATQALHQAANDARARDDRIRELTEALEIRDRVTRHGDGLYLEDSNGNLTGNPLCVSCWEERKILRSLVVSQNGQAFECAACRKMYNWHRIQLLPLVDQ